MCLTHIYVSSMYICVLSSLYPSDSMLQQKGPAPRSRTSRALLDLRDLPVEGGGVPPSPPPPPSICIYTHTLLCCLAMHVDAVSYALD